jgi:hypothetical protein
VKTNLESLKIHISAQMTPVGTKAAGVPGHRCANACDSLCGPGYVAYNSRRDAAALMTLCDSSDVSFMKETDLDERAGTLIHEGLHGITLTFPPIVPAGPPTGTEDLAYQGQRLIKFLDPATALKNTDSYVLFVRQANGQAVSVGPTTPDPSTGMAMSVTERTDVDRAVAWLEGWLIWAEQETSALYNTIHETIGAPAWTNTYYQATMASLAPLFTLTIPPALPTLDDQLAVAAIHDRIRKMSDLARDNGIGKRRPHPETVTRQLRVGLFLFACRQRKSPRAARLPA